MEDLGEYWCGSSLLGYLERIFGKGWFAQREEIRSLDPGRHTREQASPHHTLLGKGGFIGSCWINACRE